MGRSVWDDLIGQQRAVEVLRTQASEGSVAHAYLFVGPAGTGKKKAAKALACALFCEDGCGACPMCARVKRDTHPDIHVLQPEGTATYVVEQVRDLIHDVNLRPVEASRKVYLIEQADALNAESANAFLKTLEEPPGDVVFVLLARMVESVLPTIVSRCQVIRFRPMPPTAAAALLTERTGAGEDEARAALAAAGSVIPQALEFLRSQGRRAARDATVGVLRELPSMDAHDVLVATRSLLSIVKVPLDELKASQAEELRERREFVGGSERAVADRHKREMTAREREGLAEILNVTDSWFRDCLAVAGGAPDAVANRDGLDAMIALSTMPTGRFLSALAAVGESRRRISYNVSPQSAVEAMLLDIQEAFQCPQPWE